MVKAFRCTVGQRCLQAAHHLQEIFEGQIGMQPADHVEFGGAFAHALFGALVNLFEREGVGARRVRIAPKGAELAMRDADVGGIDVAVDVEISRRCRGAFRELIGQPANCEQIGERRRESRRLRRLDARRRALSAAMGFSRCVVNSKLRSLA